MIHGAKNNMVVQDTAKYASSLLPLRIARASRQVTAAASKVMESKKISAGLAFSGNRTLSCSAKYFSTSFVGPEYLSLPPCLEGEIAGYVKHPEIDRGPFLLDITNPSQSSQHNPLKALKNRLRNRKRQGTRDIPRPPGG